MFKDKYARVCEECQHEKIMIIHPLYVSRENKIYVMKWKHTGTELPPKWKAAMSAYNRALIGQKGLGRYVWCVMADFAMSMPPGLMRRLASEYRVQAEGDWQAFDDKWANPEETAPVVRREFLTAVREALEKDTKASERRRKESTKKKTKRKTKQNP